MRVFARLNISFFPLLSTLRYTYALWLMLLVFCTTLTFAQQKVTSSPPFLSDPGTAVWADSVMENLTLKERIAQLIMVAAFSNKGPSHTYEISKLIEEQGIGGVIFFQGGPVRQAKLHNHYQEISKVPLLVAMDGEWGLGMRLDSTMSFPYQMTLGAIQDVSLIKQMGLEIGKHFSRMGVHVNFAPVLDINNNPLNPVISYRSFGEDKQQVAEKGWAYAQGMQETGILANGKHFPGHGDTDIDSHYDLPRITHDLKRLNEVELYPFRYTMPKGLGSVMVAHLDIPALEPEAHIPSTLSKNIVTGLLQEKMGFEGMIFTDALNMQAVTKFYEPGIVDAKALMAGNDILLYTQDVDAAIKQIEKAILSGDIDTLEINRKCRKMLRLKAWARRYTPDEVETDQLIKDLNPTESRYLIQQLAESAMTLLKNDEEIIPLKRLDTLDIAVLSIGKQDNAFQKTLGKFTRISAYYLPQDASEDMTDSVRQKLYEHNMVIIGVHQIGRRPGISKQYNEHTQTLIATFARRPQTIISVFRNPYTLDYFPDIEQTDGLIMAYEGSAYTETAAAQLIMGAIGAKGKLPVNVNEHFRLGDGMNSTGGIRLKFTMPEDIGWDSEILNSQLDSIVNYGIAQKAYPGAQLLVAKDGKIIFHKAYGYHTYDSLRQVELADLYDFASVTKITGSLPGLMKLHDEGKFDLEERFSTYWRDWKWSNKRKLVIRDILAHQARLKPWIAYWTHTIKDNGKFRNRTFRMRPNDDYNIPITDYLYQHEKFRDKKIFKMIRKSPLNEEPGYVYSGLAFYIFPTVIVHITGQDYQDYIYRNFYHKLGAYSLTYNPMDTYPLEDIIPTERDTFFRMQQIHGSVHDEGAVMMRGVSGNAGLFGTSHDLAKLMQMYMNKGTYGGERYISKETLDEFTSYQFREEGNRRGLGFDKPPLENKDEGYVAESASDESFGHSGYTGTFTWADPKHDLLLVFFSNRVFPTRLNTKLYQLNIRPSLHQTLYDMIKHFGNQDKTGK